MSKYIDEHFNEYENKYIFSNDKFVYSFVLNEIKIKEPEKIVEINIGAKDFSALDTYNRLMNNPNVEAFNLNYVKSRTDGEDDKISIMALVLDEKTQTTIQLLQNKPEAVFEILTKLQ